MSTASLATTITHLYITSAITGEELHTPLTNTSTLTPTWQPAHPCPLLHKTGPLPHATGLLVYHWPLLSPASSLCSGLGINWPSCGHECYTPGFQRPAQSGRWKLAWKLPDSGWNAAILLCMRGVDETSCIRSKQTQTHSGVGPIKQLLQAAGDKKVKKNALWLLFMAL